MKTFAIASAALLISASAFAQTGGGRATAPGQSVVPTAPGQQYRSNGPVNDMSGASGYAPGQQYRSNGAVPGTNGASGYAPGASNPRR